MGHSNYSTRVSWIILIGLSLVWGSSFILIKKALIAFSPDVLGALRICISSLAFVPFLYFHRKEVDWKKWKLFLLIGLTGSGIPAFLYAIAQTEISSSVSGLLNSIVPIWTLLLGVVFFKVVFSYSKLIGVIVGFSGAALLMYLMYGLDLQGNPLYGLFIVAGTLCYGLSVNVVKMFFQDTKSIIVSSVSFFLIGPPALIYLLTTDVFNTIATHPHGLLSLGAVCILSLVGTVTATIIFYRLVQMTDAVFGSSVAYLMPIVAIGWGLLDGEGIGWSHLIALFMILCGVFLIKKK